jgi:hypothetical protein
MSILELIGESEIRIYTGEVVTGQSEPYKGPHKMDSIRALLKKERKGGRRWARAVAVLDGKGVDVETGETVELVECTGGDLKAAFSLVASHRGKAGRGVPKTKKTNYVL